MSVDNGEGGDRETTPKRQPIFTMPGSVTALVGLILAIHAAEMLVLDDAGRTQMALWLAFIPLRVAESASIPGGLLPVLWTPLTHAFLHANWEHVLMNAAWLAIFGTPFAQRYGALKMLIMFGLSAVAGAAFFFVLFGNGILVGASGGIAGLTGAVMRFMFQPVTIVRDPDSGEVIAAGRQLASLRKAVFSARPGFFIIIWLGLNAIVPILPGLMGGDGLSIAWQAHLGGFLAGLLLVPLFERRD